MENENEQNELAIEAVGHDQSEVEVNEPETVVEGEDTPTEQPEEVVLTIGEKVFEEKEESASSLVKHLRQLQKNLAKENQELKARIASAPQKIEEDYASLKEPTFESCEYDADLYRSELAAFFEKKAKQQQIEDRKREQAQRETESWQKVLKTYENSKKELGNLPGFEAAEDVARSVLSPVQQAIILKAADKSPLVMYALGKDIDALKNIAAEQDPILFAKAVSKYEAGIKIDRRKPEYTPEQKVQGVPISSKSNAEKIIARLKEEALASRDWTKYVSERKRLGI